MKRYETIFILKPTLTNALYTNEIDLLMGLIKEKGGKIINKEVWGIRSLAYPIQKFQKGAYLLLEFEAPTEIVDQLELNCRRNDNIIRFLTTAPDKDAIAYSKKRIERLKKNKQTQKKEEGKSIVSITKGEVLDSEHTEKQVEAPKVEEESKEKK